MPPLPTFPQDAGFGSMFIRATNLAETRIHPDSIANIEQALNRLAPVSVSISCRWIPCPGGAEAPAGRRGEKPPPRGCKSFRSGPTLSDATSIGMEFRVKVEVPGSVGGNLTMKIQASATPSLLSDGTEYSGLCSEQNCQAEDYLEKVKVQVMLRGTMTFEAGVDAVGMSLSSDPDLDTLGLTPGGDSSGALDTRGLGDPDHGDYLRMRLNRIGPESSPAPAGGPGATGIGVGAGVTIEINYPYIYEIEKVRCP